MTSTQQHTSSIDVFLAQFPKVIAIEERLADCQRQLDVVRGKIARLEETSPRIYMNLNQYLKRLKELKGKELGNKEEFNFVRQQVKTLLDEKEQTEKEYQELRQKERMILLQMEELKKNEVRC